MLPIQKSSRAMKTKKPVVEVWKSNTNKSEIHFFDPDDRNTYIAGFNPVHVPVGYAMVLIRNAGYSFPEEARNLWSRLRKDA